MVQALCEVVGMWPMLKQSPNHNGVHLDHVSMSWCTHINNPFNRRVCTACTLYFCLPNRVGAGTTVSTWTWGSPTHCRNLGAVKLFHLVLESQVRKLSQGSSESWRLSICHVSLSVSQLKLNWGLKRKHIYNFNNNCKDKIKFLWSCSSVFHQ